MKTSLFKRTAPAVLALGLAGGLVGVSAGSAFATTTKSLSGTIKTVNIKANKLTVTVGKKRDTFIVTPKTKVTLSGKTSAFADLKVNETATVDYTVSGKTWTATSISAKTAVKS